MNIEPLGVAGLQVDVRFYPHGTSVSSSSAPSVVVHVPSAVYNDQRQLHVECLSDSIVNSIPESLRFTKSLSEFCRLGGTHKTFNEDMLQSLSKFEFTVILYHDPLFVPERTKLICLATQKLINFHASSRKNGDITLVVKVNKDEDGEDSNSDLYAPPSKKQKRNPNENENSHSDDESEKDMHNDELKMSSIILKASSPVFDGMLSSKNNMLEQQQKRIIVHAKSAKDVEDMLYFMSTDELRDDCNALNVIQLAQFYQMDRLLWKCINKLLKEVTVKSFVDTISIFDKHEISEGYQALVDFAKKNIAALQKEPNFLQLSHSFRCGIL